MGKVVLFIYGTRPEAIKMAPLIKEFTKHADNFRTSICLTGQHREMLTQVNSFFDIKADYDLNLMKPNQNLFDFTANCLKAIEPVILESKPDLVFVQGDTASVLAGTIASYYLKVPVAHLEAGLRSGDIYSPFPEEVNRRIASQIAQYHFAPTSAAAENLKKSGITKNVHVVGNTVIDALNLGLEIIKKRGDREYKTFFNMIDFSKKIILVTGHRRESFGTGFENICDALYTIALECSDCEIVYPVHLNPKVQAPVIKKLSNSPNIHLLAPLDYPYLIWLMGKSYFVMTDSGGIQEEAPALGKPVLVMRDVTERMEGIQAGTAVLVGTEYEQIVKNAKELLSSSKIYLRMAQAVNPYGDGKTSARIVKLLDQL